MKLLVFQPSLLAQQIAVELRDPWISSMLSGDLGFRGRTCFIRNEAPDTSLLDLARIAIILHHQPDRQLHAIYFYVRKENPI